MKSAVDQLDNLVEFMKYDQNLGDPEIRIDYDELSLVLVKEAGNLLKGAEYFDKFGWIQMEETGIDESVPCVQRKVRLQESLHILPFS